MDDMDLETYFHPHEFSGIKKPTTFSHLIPPYVFSVLKKSPTNDPRWWLTPTLPGLSSGQEQGHALRRSTWHFQGGKNTSDFFGGRNTGKKQKNIGSWEPKVPPAKLAPQK